jgi:ankyrin repeat protein
MTVNDSSDDTSTQRSIIVTERCSPATITSNRIFSDLAMQQGTTHSFRYNLHSMSVTSAVHSNDEMNSQELDLFFANALFGAPFFRQFAAPFFRHHPLHLASDDGHLGDVKMLLDRGFDIEAKTRGGCTPLHLASSSGHVAVVEELLRRRADFHATNNQGELPVHEAIRYQEKAMVKCLLKHFYASLLDQSRFPLHALIEDADSVPLEKAVLGDSLIEDYSSDSDSDVPPPLLPAVPLATGLLHPPLRLAFYEDVLSTMDVLEIIEFLIGRNPAVLSVHDQDGSLPLHVAAATSAPIRILQYLVEHTPGRAMVARTTDGAYPLHVALEHGASSEVIRLLLNQGPGTLTCTLRNDAGETPLHVACRCGSSFATVRTLVDHFPASVKSMTRQGDLPLFLACSTAGPSLDAIYFLMNLYPDVLISSQ